MPLRSDWLSPALEILSDNLHVLPAVGGAMEDLERPDADETDDLLVNSDVNKVTDFLETPAPGLSNLYRPTPPIYRFGVPGEDLQAVVDTALYASHRVGLVIPMLFTTVPGSTIFDDYGGYLLDEMKWDLQDLNGKRLPFLEYNRRRYLDLHASDYLELEAFMMHLNSSKVYQKRFDLVGDSTVVKASRGALIASA